LSQTWQAMQVVKDKNLTKHIGVSNCNSHKINDLIEKTNIKPEVNQVEIHPYFQQTELVNFCRKKNIIVTAYSPLGGRIMRDKSGNILDDKVLQTIAAKHQATVVQIALAYTMQHGIAVIPKSVRAERIKENFGSLDIKLSAAEMSQIADLDRNARVTEGSWATFPGSPYTQKWLWEE